MVVQRLGYLDILGVVMVMGSKAQICHTIRIGILGVVMVTEQNYK